MSDKEKDIVVLPKGTVFNINGYCGELLQDTPVLSPDIKKLGLGHIEEYISDIPACNQRFYKPKINKDYSKTKEDNSI